MEALVTALSTAMQTVQTNAETMIATGLPYALAIGGTVIAISIGWKTFKRFTK